MGYLLVVKAYCRIVQVFSFLFMACHLLIKANF
jgi:hypothetical protein